MKTKIIFGVFLFLFVLVLFTGFSGCDDTIGTGNFNKTIKVVNSDVPISLEAIDQDYYAIAKSQLDLIYSGTSHSSQINTGVAELASREPWCSWTFREGTYGLDGDLGNPDFTT